MYEPFPASGPVPAAPRLAPPRPLQNAVRLMYVGVALEVIAFVVALATRGSLKTPILTAHPDYTTVQLHVGLAAIVLIFSKDSGPFCRQRPGYG